MKVFDLEDAEILDHFNELCSRIEDTSVTANHVKKIMIALRKR